MSGHAIAPIPMLAAYFDDPKATPIVTAEYKPVRGWVPTGYRKRISIAWARKLRAEGIVAVSLTYAGRTADFSLEEILRSTQTKGEIHARA